MDLRAILARQAAKDKAGGTSRAPPPLRTQAVVQPGPTPHSPTPSSGSTVTPHDHAALERKRKRPEIPVPEVVVLPSSQTGGDGIHLEEPSSARTPASPPRFPSEYTAATNLFTGGPNKLGFHILHSLGSAAEQQHLAATKLKPCTLEGCNDIVRVTTLTL